MSVIGLSAEVRVCTVLTRETGGTYHVILDENHFKELLMLHVKPPPASSSSECSLIRMGQYIDTNRIHNAACQAIENYGCPLLNDISTVCMYHIYSLAEILGTLVKMTVLYLMLALETPSRRDYNWMIILEDAVYGAVKLDCIQYLSVSVIYPSPLTKTGL